MNEIIPIQRPWATVNAPVPTPPPAPPMRALPSQTIPTQSASNGVPDRRPRDSLGWAAVNQPAPTPDAQTYVTNSGFIEIASSSSGRPGKYGKGEPSKKDENVPREESSAALIDLLPKNQQRKVYGLVSGLQGGIQQLQRELDLLKKALGIDEED